MVGINQTLREFLEMPLTNTEAVFRKFATLQGVIHRGVSPEQFLYIPGSRTNRVLLVAHADTVWDNNYRNDAGTDVQHTELQIENGVVRNLHGGLGADDRAGCAMVWLLRDLGHSILITDGEEKGRMGSKWLRDNNGDIYNEINDSHQFVVQLDRCNGSDFKCYGVGSDEFREYIACETGYSEPNRCSYTDIVILCSSIVGVNLSIGYHNEHHSDEYLDNKEWENTLTICRRWLSHSELPKFNLLVEETSAC